MSPSKAEQVECIKCVYKMKLTSLKVVSKGSKL